MADKPLPKAWQNQDPDSPQYGTIAVEAFDQVTGDRRPGVVLVGNPRTGAHWATDSDVAGWAALS